MPTERLFIAIKPPDVDRHELYAYATAISSQVQEGTLRPMKEENLHITLHFLGDVDVTRIDSLRSLIELAIRREGLSSFSVTTDAVGFFPSRSKPRVVQIGIIPSPELHSLHEKLAEALAAEGFAVENRRYRPHITLAKLGRRTPAQSVANIRQRFEGGLSQPLTFLAESMHVISSELTPRGSIYTDAAVIKLGDRPGQATGR